MCADLPTEDVLPILGHAREVCHGSFNNILAANEYDAIGASKKLRVACIIQPSSEIITTRYDRFILFIAALSGE